MDHFALAMLLNLEMMAPSTILISIAGENNPSNTQWTNSIFLCL